MPRKTKKELDIELLIAREQLQIFANALQYLILEGQGIVVDVAEETKLIHPEVSVISVIHFEGKLRIDLIKDQEKRKPGDRLLFLSPDKNLN